MRWLYLIITLATLSFQAPQKSTLETKVFVCVSSTAHVYHQDRDCRGLQACTHEIKKVSLTEAENKYKRRACKVCY